jgi:pimeloyl-ACP methyl ester carboxylesterase
MAFVESRTFDLDGPLHYADFGGSGRPIVLVHGLGGSHVDWIDVGPRMAERTRVLAPDLIGHGYTEPLGRSASIWSNRDIVDRFIREVAGEPAVVMGNSMGGLIAMLEGAENPDSVTGLVLVDPAIPQAPGVAPDPVVEQLFLLYDTPGAGELILRQMAEAIGVEATFDQLMGLICADPTRLSPQMRRAQLDMANERLGQAWTDEAFFEATRTMLQLTHHDPSSWPELLAAVNAPTLLVEGTMDRLVPLGSVEAAAAARPDWTFAPVEGIGHVPQMEDPEGFVDLVLPWLESRGLLAPAAVLSFERA